MYRKAQRINMKLKEIIKQTFEEEYKKEAMHIGALEQSILSQTKKEKQPHSPFVWVYKMPYAFAAIILFLIIGTATVAATDNPIKDTIRQITERLQKAAEEALQSGGTTIDERGQRVFTGKTADEMEKLHKEAQDQIKELKSRPASERLKTITYLKTWIDKYLYTAPNMPKQDDIQYGNVVALNSDPTHQVEIYYSHDYEFQIDPETNKLYDVSIRGARGKEDKEVTYMDMTSRYTQDELEQMAKEFIKKQLPGIDLNKLKFEKGSKINTYFFTWTGDESMKKPLKDPKGFKVCGDVASPKFKDENGAPCIMQKEAMTLPSIQVGFTQGGQLIGYTNGGF